MPIYRATATSLTNLVAADGSSGGFVQDAQTGAGGLAILDDASIAAVQQTLAGAGSIYGHCRVLWRIISADMNSTADQSFTKIGTFTTFLNVRILAANASTGLTTAVGGIYSAAAKAGSAIVANTQAWTGATATAGTGHAAAITAAGTGVQPFSELYLSLTTPQGGAATADLYVIGIPLS